MNQCCISSDQISMKYVDRRAKNKKDNKLKSKIINNIMSSTRDSQDNTGSSLIIAIKPKPKIIINKILHSNKNDKILTHKKKSDVFNPYPWIKINNFSTRKGKTVIKIENLNSK